MAQAAPRHARSSLSHPTDCLVRCNARAQHPFCIITRVRNYAEWIPEWIEYHHLLGASKIFIVDDCSQDNGLTQRVLQFYHALKYVEFWEDVGPPVQPHCNDTARRGALLVRIHPRQASMRLGGGDRR